MNGFDGESEDIYDKMASHAKYFKDVKRENLKKPLTDCLKSLETLYTELPGNKDEENPCKEYTKRLLTIIN